MAGTMLANSVIPMPRTSGTITVRARTTVSAWGSCRSRAANSADSPSASRIPAPIPTADAITPITKPSSTTDRSTCRRDAPRVRSVASSRVRCATVIESVLKMTNAPTNSETPPKPSRK